MMVFISLESKTAQLYTYCLTTKTGGSASLSILILLFCEKGILPSKNVIAIFADVSKSTLKGVSCIFNQLYKNVPWLAALTATQFPFSRLNTPYADKYVEVDSCDGIKSSAFSIIS